uniref:UVR domain-containing protein n=2 Tax=Mucochytrium quahogii TaxID=96639 RepID=A0A7S2WCC3_9STRA|mmetsp:Transcript_18847/g.40868  ORF Transcript_18847/g.40868 Transcript_18847/m.40868 type:complete len:771 (+) Transcript_18847:951-3263(+)
MLSALEADNNPEAEEGEEEEEVGEGGGELDELLRAFRRTAKQFSNGLRKVNEEIERNGVSLEKIEEDALALSNRLSDLENEQSAALEAEDFEKAEMLQRTIDAVNRSVGEIESRRQYLGRQAESLKLKKDKVFEDQVSGIEVIAELLGDCSKRETEKAKALCDEVADEIKIESGRLDEEDELLRVEVEGVEEDLKVVTKEQSKINAKVNAATVELRQERDGWEEKISLVDLEIAELRRQLAEKEAKRSELDGHLSEVNQGIQAARSKYESRLNELDSRCAAIKEKDELARARSEAIGNSREKLEEKYRNAAEKAKEMEVSAQQIASQLVILTDIANRLKREGRSRRGSEGGSTPTASASEQSKIRKLEDEILVTTQSIGFLERDAQKLELEAVEHGRALFDIDSKLPALNDQKKLAVSTRNFKEAGRVAKEIKDLTAEKEEVEAKVKETKEKLQVCNESLAAKNSEIVAFQEQLKSMQSGVNDTILKDLQAKRLALHADIKRVESSGSVAENSFGATILKLLRTELDACEVEARRVSVKICGDESLAVLSMDDEDCVDIEGESSPVGIDATDGTENKGEEAVCAVIPRLSVEEYNEKITDIEAKVETAVLEEDYELAAKLDEELEILRAELEVAKKSTLSNEDSLLQVDEGGEGEDNREEEEETGKQEHTEDDEQPVEVSNEIDEQEVVSGEEEKTSLHDDAIEDDERSDQDENVGDINAEVEDPPREDDALDKEDIGDPLMNTTTKDVQLAEEGNGHQHREVEEDNILS